MAETSFPIAAGAGITEDTYERLMAQVMGVGRSMLVNGSGDPLATGYETPMVYADSTGRQYKVRANNAYTVRGFRWESGTDDLVFPLNANTSGKTRIDRAVLRLDRSTYTLRVATLPGTPADAPTPPAVTRQVGSTGLYEVAIGKITVRSNAGSGLPSIAAGDVVDETVRLTPPGLAGLASLMPSPLAPGAFYTQHDQRRVWAGVGGGSILVGDNGPFTKIAAAGGWTNDLIYAQRVNGFVYLQAVVTLAGSSGKAPSTDLVVCTLPAHLRPGFGRFLFSCWMTPNQVAVGSVDGTTGQVQLNTYGQTFPAGGQAVIGPFTFPANGVLA